jgi:hypothetical protein
MRESWISMYRGECTMVKKTALVSMACLIGFAPMVVGNDGLGTYDEDLSGYGQPQPTNHHSTWQKPHQVTPTAVDAEIVQALRRAHRDDGLGSYTEDVSGYGMNANIVSTFAVTD